MLGKRRHLQKTQQKTSTRHCISHYILSISFFPGTCGCDHVNIYKYTYKYATNLSIFIKIKYKFVASQSYIKLKTEN